MTNPFDDLDPVVRVASFDQGGAILMIGDRPLSIAMRQIGEGEPIILVEIDPAQADRYRVDLATLTLKRKDQS